ncbi:alpha-amylase family glycosyl hydrolase [Vallicoccus soli]|uniref:Glycosyl hydrolase family 13 catalytic domain-containing protein n=1 Tax=Vallicoccus soli TaxID=2339232 RepID=A0A3A3ZED2_9ACTN|nr:alpha-amylase family glycosyl hydrolase [Vallicoccus soli]RJK93475.1 hypothetical protein D5H78_16815 [Vallicoccus soli]
MHPPASRHRRRRARKTLAPALAAGLVATLPAVGAALPASAAPATGAPVLVGSLQSELGCARDWDAACSRTRLQPAGDGTWSRVLTVPKGTWRVQVADDGARYAPDGSAARGPVVVAGDVRLRFTYDEATRRTTVVPVARAAGVTAADRRLAARGSLREDLTRERFYFVMADRFENGDPSNDLGGLPADRLQSGYDPEHRGFYHGGDIRGIIERLDYIQGMGTTAIWLTPSFKNKPVQGPPGQESAGYHGYWITDFTQIDPHLGTNEDLRELTDAAHARGMKVFFDIITNHTADVIDYAEGEYDYVSKEQVPYRDASGEVFDDRDVAGSEDFPPLDPQTSFPYTPVFPQPSDATVKVPAWLNDPTMYHNRGNARFDGTESDEYGDFVGLDDLFTERPEVVDGMSEVYEAWAGFGIDGFRIDTVKHVNIEFWQEFAPRIEAAAEAAGTPDFFSFGEVYDADPRKTSRYTTEGGLQATLDFGFQASATGFGQGRATTGLRDFFAKDDWYTDADSNAYSLPTFLGNHDMGRIGKFLADSGASGDELLERDRLTHALMYLTRGQPVVYYGDEQGFVGDGNDQLARQDMFASQVAEYNDDDLIGTDATTAEENFDPEHPLYRHLAELSALREEHPTLADGAQVHRFASGDAGVYAFSRISDADDVEHLVATNNSTTERTVVLDTFSAGMRFDGLWPAGTGAVTSDAEGRVAVTVPPLSAVVWKASGPLAPARRAPQVQFRAEAGSTVGGRAEVGAVVPGGGFDQVSFAYRRAGTSAWTPLGTDDNAPYRVFHDVTGLPAGSVLEYRAVLRDHSGNFSVAQSSRSVGAPAPEPVAPRVPVAPEDQPDRITVPGDFGQEVGCSGDWDPGCTAIDLQLDPADGIWKGTLDVPAGNWAFKAAVDGTWDESYGAGGGSGNIALAAPGGPVTFFYDHATHAVETSAGGGPRVVTGTFQDELGCAADGDAACLRSWLQDLDGDRTATFATTGIPAGTYEARVGDGAPVAFSVAQDGLVTTFAYDTAAGALVVGTSAPVAVPDLATARASWARPGLVLWDLDAAGADRRGWSYRLHWSEAPGGLALDAQAVVGGASVPLTEVGGPGGGERERLRLAPADARRLAGAAAGQWAVAAYDDLGRLVDATGLVRP